jgi:hypothetical protein
MHTIAMVCIGNTISNAYHCMPFQYHCNGMQWYEKVIPLKYHCNGMVCKGNTISQCLCIPLHTISMVLQWHAMVCIGNFIAYAYHCNGMQWYATKIPLHAI